MQMLQRNRSFILAFCFLALCFAERLSAETTAPAAPDYSSFKQSFHMRYANAKPVDFDHLSSLYVRASINGGPPMRFQIDTGSVGVIVGAGDVPNIDPQAAAGSITYSSSGVELDGVWTNAVITFPDSKDENGNVATVMVPVLAASQCLVHPGAVNGNAHPATTEPVKNPKVFMFGIGTGRGKEVHQDRNPWVNLEQMQAGTMRRGYMLTRDGITLGLSTEAVGQGFLFEKLNEHVGSPAVTGNGPKDWDSARGWVTVAGIKQENSSMLLDTGLTNMMLVQPNGDDHTDVPAGTEITVNLLSGRLKYSFKVGDTEDPFTPRKVTYVKRAVPLVNTGLRVLAKFDYLYDADGGYLGLRPIKQ
jgi:hypothetical protein